MIEENLSNAIGLSIESMDKLLLAKNNDGDKMEISVFNNKTYKELHEEVIKLEFRDSKKLSSKHQILSMTVCDNERSLAVIYG